MLQLLRPRGPLPPRCALHPECGAGRAERPGAARLRPPPPASCRDPLQPPRALSGHLGRGGLVSGEHQHGRARPQLRHRAWAMGRWRPSSGGPDLEAPRREGGRWGHSPAGPCPHSPGDKGDPATRCHHRAWSRVGRGQREQAETSRLISSRGRYPTGPQLPLGLCPSAWFPLQCSATCGEATQHRSVFCTNNTGVPCDEAQRPATGAPCSLPPCPRGPDPEGSGSGSPSHEFFNEIDFFPHRLASRPLLPSPFEPASMGNAIEEDPEPGLPGPVFVDDFYYDYNFINFHEDLSYGPFNEPDPDPAGAGDWTPPPLNSPAESPTGTPLPVSEPPGTAKEGPLGDGTPAPWPSQAGRALAPPSEQAPGNPLVNFLPEEDTPTGAPDLGFPSWPWIPASVGGMETPAAPGGQNRLPGGEDGQSQPSPPRWQGANKLSEDEEEDLDARTTSLPQGPRPTSPPLPSFSTSRASPSPDTGDPGTVGTVAWEPVLGGGQGPVDTELGPPIGGAPSPPAPATLPATWGRAGPLEPGTPTPSAPWDLQTAAVPGTFLPMPTPGLEHPFWELAPGPGSEAPPSPVLLPAPAQDSSANSSRVPEAEPLDPSLAEDGPPAGNASWEVGNWSEVRRWGRVGPADRALVGKRALPPRRVGMPGRLPVAPHHPVALRVPPGAVGPVSLRFPCEQ